MGLISDSLRKGGMTGPMTGTDLSPKMIELAQQRGNYSKTFVHDLEVPLPYPDRSVSESRYHYQIELTLSASLISSRAPVPSN